MENLSYNIRPNRGFGSFLKSIFENRSIDGSFNEINETDVLLEAIKGTKMELESVQKLFNNISDPDLIEYAIYQEYAIKLRYSYLVKKAKEKHIKSINFTAI